jgi:hypothetical protein
MAKKAVGPRDYKPIDIKRLCLLSGNECACPSCANKLIARDGISIIGKICHIEAASPEGSRYNPSQTNDERRSFDNLILLCDVCHTIIDNKANEATYPVKLLKEWKQNHESKYLTTLLPQLPNCFQIIIDAIVKTDLFDIDFHDQPSCYKPEEKISYNSLIRNRFLIEDYNVFTQPLHVLYNELEEQGSFKKSILLARIHSEYLKIKGRYIGNATDSIAQIRQYADDIFDEMVEFVMTTVASDSQDALLVGAYIVVVDAFIECKILEKPI